MIRAVLIACAMTLAACAPEPSEPEPAPEAEPAAQMPANAEEATAQDTCGAAQYEHLIGQPASSVDQASLPPGTRIITPETMVTQDFSPQRLNIMTGTDGRISSMRCF